MFIVSCLLLISGNEDFLHLLPRLTALCHGCFDLEAHGVDIKRDAESCDTEGEDDVDDEEDGTELSEDELREILEKASVEKTRHTIYAYVAIPAYQKDDIVIKTILEEPDLVASLHETAVGFQREAMKRKMALLEPLKKRLEYRFRRYAHAVTYQLRETDVWVSGGECKVFLLAANAFDGAR